MNNFLLKLEQSWLGQLVLQILNSLNGMTSDRDSEQDNRLLARGEIATYCHEQGKKLDERRRLWNEGGSND